MGKDTLMPTKALRGPGGLTVEQLLAFHHAVFGDTVMVDDDAGTDDTDGDAGTDDTGTDDDTDGDGTDDTGSFPARTRVSDMDPAQQAAYWKHKARKHEEREKAFGDVTPAQVQEWRSAHERLTEMEHDLMTDQELALDDAREQGRQDAETRWLPRVAGALLEAEAARQGVDTETLDTALEFVDSGRFVVDDDIDRDKVTRFIEQLAAKNTGHDTDGDRIGPSASGAGRRTSKTGPSLENGQAAYAARHPKQNV